MAYSTNGTKFEAEEKLNTSAIIGNHVYSLYLTKT